MNILKNALLAVALVSPVAAMSQTTGASAGSSSGSATSTATDQAERDRPQGGSTAGANGRQDPTIKLSNGTSDNANGGAGKQPVAGQRSRPSQGGSSAGANGAQDPTIKSDWATQQAPASK